MIIKVCGMRHNHNINEVAALGIDMMGFIFHPQSPRFIGSDPVGMAATQANGVARVGVFVNESTERILQAIELHNLNAVQLHGSETPEMCETLRLYGCMVIKAISVACAHDVALAHHYAPHSDMLLFDTRTPLHGGSGTSFDWSLLHSYTGNTPFLLSGGITPRLLPALARFHHSMWEGVDLNSGFEIAPALKDTSALHLFINAFKQLNTTQL